MTSEEGEEQFRLYYSCYFNKYYRLSSNQSNSNRDLFVSSLLVEAVAAEEEAPSEDCVVWMCEENLAWLQYRHSTKTLLEVKQIIQEVKLQDDSRSGLTFSLGLEMSMRAL